MPEGGEEGTTQHPCKGRPGAEPLSRFIPAKTNPPSLPGSCPAPVSAGAEPGPAPPCLRTDKMAAAGPRPAPCQSGRATRPPSAIGCGGAGSGSRLGRAVRLRVRRAGEGHPAAPRGSSRARFLRDSQDTAPPASEPHVRLPSQPGARSPSVPEAVGLSSPPGTMFVLVEMTDTVRIPPWQFERKLNESIAEELNKKLANKVKRGSRIG